MTLETSRVSLYYEKSGAGRPIILLHGNGEDHRIFGRSIAVLEKNFSVYAVDTRGHGKSSPAPSLHYEDMAEDVYELICGLRLEKPVVYGFSDGGIAALLLGIKYPQLLSRLIVSGVNTRPEGLKSGWLALFKAGYFFTKSEKLRLMAEEPDISGEMLRRIKIPVSITAGGRDMIKQAHLRGIAAQIPGSTLTVFPGESHDSYVVNSEKIADFIVKVCAE